jgi:hypothetical protein
MSSYPPDDPYPPPDFQSGAFQPMPPDHDPYAQSAGAVSARVTPPAVALLVMAIVNVLAGLGLAGFGTIYTQMPPEKFEQIMEQQNPAQFNQMKQMGWSVKTFINIYIFGGLGGGCVALGVSLLVILGAIRMMMLRSYGLAVFASILMAIPCISPAACCLLGEGIGIWALVVLLSPEVRAAFR